MLKKVKIVKEVEVHTLGEGQLEQQGCDHYVRGADEHCSTSLFLSLHPNQPHNNNKSNQTEK